MVKKGQIKRSQVHASAGKEPLRAESESDAEVGQKEIFCKGLLLTGSDPTDTHTLMADRIRVGSLVSGGGTNLQAIIDACNSNQIDAKVVFVGSDNPHAYGLERAKKHGISTFVVDYQTIIEETRGRPLEGLVPGDFDVGTVLSKQGIHPRDSDREKVMRYFSTRAIAEAALLREMTPHPFDLLALAGFMRIVTPYFIDHINTDPSRPRIMNIHPALLPSFPGVDGYGDTYRYGCKVGGCTVHFVDYGEDTGPIIGQKTFEITPDDTIDTIKEKGLRIEHQLYAECIRLFAEDRLKVVSKTYTLENGAEFTRKVVEITA
jgi:phosphoribosylglycinamide formyltransferase-1